MKVTKQSSESLTETTVTDNDWYGNFVKIIDSLSSQQASMLGNSFWIFESWNTDINVR